MSTRVHCVDARCQTVSASTRKGGGRCVHTYVYCVGGGVGIMHVLICT